MASLSISNRFTALPAHSKPIESFPQKAYKHSKHIWDYLGKVLILTRHSLNATVRISHYLQLCTKNLDEKVFQVVTRLRLFSMVSLTFGLASVPTVAARVLKHVHLQDKEGIALAGLSVSILTMDIVDSFITFVNPFLITLSRAPIAIFSTIGLPLVFGLISTGIFSRMVQIAKTHSLFMRLKREVYAPSTYQTCFQLRQFLENNLGGETRIAQEKKRASFQHAVSPQAVQVLEKLHTDFQHRKVMMPQQILTDLDRASSLLSEKMKIDAANLFTSFLSLGALSLSLAGFISPLIPLLLVASYALRILALAYEDLSLKPLLSIK